MSGFFFKGDKKILGLDIVKLATNPFFWLFLIRKESFIFDWLRGLKLFFENDCNFVSTNLLFIEKESVLDIIL